MAPAAGSHRPTGPGPRQTDPPAASPAAAQVIDNVSDAIAALGALAGASEPQKYVSLTGIESAVTAPRGTGFFSATVSSKRIDNATNSYVPGEDSSFAFGFGFGDAADGIGVQVTGNILSTNPDDFAADGYLGLKFSRRIDGGTNPTYIGLSVNGLLPWGDARYEPKTHPLNPDIRKDPSATLAITRFTDIGGDSGSFPLMMTLGYGTNVKNNGQDAAAIFGIGLGIGQNASLSLSTNTEYVNVGLGWTFPGLDGYSFSLTANDPTNDANKRRMTLGVSYQFNTFGGNR